MRVQVLHDFDLAHWRIHFIYLCTQVNSGSLSLNQSLTIAVTLYWLRHSDLGLILLSPLTSAKHYENCSFYITYGKKFHTRFEDFVKYS